MISILAMNWLAFDTLNRGRHRAFSVQQSVARSGASCLMCPDDRI